MRVHPFWWCWYCLSLIGAFTFGSAGSLCVGIILLFCFLIIPDMGEEILRKRARRKEAEQQEGERNGNS